MAGLHIRRVLLACLLGLVIIFTAVTRRRSSPQQCNPYSQPGYLSISTNPHLNKWIPFLSSCTSPALVPALLRENWKLQPAPGGSDVREPEGWWDGEFAPDGGEWEDVKWAKGRTVLVVGDSVARFNVRYLCEMAGEPMREIGWDHPWSPPKPTVRPPKPLSERVPETAEEFASYAAPAAGGHQRHRNPLKAGHGHKRSPSPQSSGPDQGDNPTANSTSSVSTPLALRKRAAFPIGDQDGYMGHYCHLPGVDLMVIQVFNFGLDEKNFWTVRDDFIPPSTLEDRLSYFALPYVRAAERQSTAPELMYLGSALWDTTRWMREDAEAGREISEGVSGERLVWYRTRVRQVLVHAKRLFPNTSLKWLSHHYPLRAMTGWFFENGPSGQKPNRPQQRLNRLLPLQQAALSAVQDIEDAPPAEREILRDVGTARWGELMMGQEDHQRDDLHQRLLPGGYLWADMMLYDLREAVTQKSWSWLGRE